jgi:Leucine-rich repeat (LRR) protein
MKTRKIHLFIGMLFLSFFSNTLAMAQDFSTACSDAEVFYDFQEALAAKDKVKKLDLSMQKIKVLSPSIAQCKNLECLDLSFNTFSTLPAEFAQLKQLTYLNLTGTRYMGKLPTVLKELPNLKVIDLRDHPEWSKATFEEAKKLLPHVNIITP